MTDKLAKWLNEKFLSWQSQTGERKTIGDFAIYLGVNEGALGHWMNGRRSPSRANADQISRKLGYEILDILGFARPAESYFDELPPDLQEALLSGARSALSKMSASGIDLSSPEGKNILTRELEKSIATLNQPQP